MTKYRIDVDIVKKEINENIGKKVSPTSTEIAEAVGSLPFCMTTTGIFRARNNPEMLVGFIKDAQVRLADPEMKEETIKVLGKDVVNAIINWRKDVYKTICPNCGRESGHIIGCDSANHFD